MPVPKDYWFEHSNAPIREKNMDSPTVGNHRKTHIRCVAQSDTAAGPRH